MGVMSLSTLGPDSRWNRGSANSEVFTAPFRLYLVFLCIWCSASSTTILFSHGSFYYAVPPNRRPCVHLHRRLRHGGFCSRGGGLGAVLLWIQRAVRP